MFYNAPGLRSLLIIHNKATKHAVTVQQGINHTQEPFFIGIGPEIAPQDASGLTAYTESRLKTELAVSCTLEDNIPEYSQPHTLIAVHGLAKYFNNHDISLKLPDTLTVITKAWLVAAGYDVHIHEGLEMVYPELGIGLFFRKKYQTSSVST